MARQKRNSNMKILLLAIGFLVIGIFLYFRWGINSNSNNKNALVGFKPTGFSLKYDYGNIPYTYYSNSGFFFCTKDGVKRFDTDGKLKWDYPFSMNSPVMIGEGGQVVVSENKSKVAFVFNETELLYKIEKDDPIISVSINKSGQAVVTTLSKLGGYNLDIYNNKGEIIYPHVSEDANVFPISTDVSDDGRIFAVSFLNTRGLSMSSSINFYYIKSNEAQGFQDGMFASSGSIEDQIISKIDFTKNNKLIYFSDLQIGCIETGADNHLKQLWKIELENEVEETVIVNDSIIAIALGKPLVNKRGYPEGTLLFTDLESGEITFEYSAKNKIRYLKASDSSIVVGSGNLGKDFTAFNLKGEILWEYRAIVENSEIMILDKTNKILNIMPLSLEIMEMGKINSNDLNINNYKIDVENEVIIPEENEQESIPPEEIEGNGANEEEGKNQEETLNQEEPEEETTSSPE